MSDSNILTIQVSAAQHYEEKKQLNLQPEIQSQLQPGNQYRVISKDNCIVLEKITTTTVDLDEFLQQLEELNRDPNKSTLQEISQIVKEVRRELWSDQ